MQCRCLVVREYLQGFLIACILLIINVFRCREEELLPTASDTFLPEERWVPRGAVWRMKVTVQVLKLNQSKQIYLMLTEYSPV